jgi:ComF family protein
LKSVYSFTSARSTGQFETLLRDLIHRFKYQGQVAVGEKLGRFMAESDYVDFRIADYSLMIPIPLHRKRLQDRGFNQSVILSREISRYHGIPMRFDVLKRTIYTEPQVSLGRDDRNRNVQGAFEVTERGAIEGERILLIDDVYTTGSTVNECAGVLRQSGAEDVSVLTLARGL